MDILLLYYYIGQYWLLYAFIYYMYLWVCLFFLNKTKDCWLWYDDLKMGNNILVYMGIRMSGIIIIFTDIDIKILLAIIHIEIGSRSISVFTYFPTLIYLSTFYLSLMIFCLFGCFSFSFIVYMLEIKISNQIYIIHTSLPSSNASVYSGCV